MWIKETKTEKSGKVKREDKKISACLTEVFGSMEGGGFLLFENVPNCTVM